MERQGFWKRLFSPLRRSDSNSHCDESSHDSHGPESLVFPNFYLQNRMSATYEKFRTTMYTPKCLTSINSSMMLFGEHPPESYSADCWLDNVLDQFGVLTFEEDSSLNSDGQDHMVDDPFMFDETTSFDEDSISVSMDFQDESISNDVDESVSVISMLRHRRDSLESTVSEVLNMLDNTIMCYSSNPPQPPPYSEICDSSPSDPPPAYSDIFGIGSNNNLNENVSRTMNIHNSCRLNDVFDIVSQTRNISDPGRRASDQQNFLLW